MSTHIEAGTSFQVPSPSTPDNDPARQLALLVAERDGRGGGDVFANTLAFDRLGPMAQARALRALGSGPTAGTTELGE